MAPTEEEHLSVTVPSVEDLKRPTLECLRDGITSSYEIRDVLAERFGLPPYDRSGASGDHARFVNNHAWALVRLQQEGLIVKVGASRYALTDRGLNALASDMPGIKEGVQAPSLSRMPTWAKKMIAHAIKVNGHDGPRFDAGDLLALWNECGGRCAITRLPFSNEKVGSGQAKRAFAPSLDRIDPEGPYSRENCRLVMIAVNFAMNAWGEEVYLGLARAAVRADEKQANAG